MRLNKRAIDAASYNPDGPSQQVLWDDQLPNFGLRLYDSGAKAFVIRYRNQAGQRRYMTIGRFGLMTVQEARAAAMEALASVKNQGADPVEEVRRESAETIERLAEAFIEKHCRIRRKTWETDRRRLEIHILPRWKGRAPASITRGELADLHREIGKETPIEANRVIQLLRVMFNFAVDEGMVPETFNPLRRFNFFPEKSRDRWLRPHEIPALFGAIGEVDNIYIRNFYLVLLLTATRRNELLLARWDQVSFERRELRIPETKNGTSHTIPLSSAAIDLLQELPRQLGNPYIFCSHIAGQSLQAVNRRWNTVREKAGLDDVVLHDFRRTAASWIAQAGYSEIVIKALLNHTLEGATAVYTRMQPEAVREAVEAYGQSILEASRGDNANVIPLATAKARR
jgi:integrase